MAPPSTNKAVILLSGGLDSTTILTIAQLQGFTPYALSFRYGQRHHHEIRAAEEIAKRANVAQHLILDVDLGAIGASALTTKIPVPKNQSVENISTSIPVTYVPARNTVFLALALAWAESLEATDLFIGVNSLDYSGYPDCRPEYIAAFQAMANLATKSAIEGTRPIVIHAPLIHLTKAQIIRKGLEIGVDYSLTTSCYDPSPSGAACQHCDACLLRRKGFEENQLHDPAEERGEGGESAKE